MIEIKDLKVNFGEQEVLRGIDWFITPKSRIGRLSICPPESKLRLSIYIILSHHQNSPITAKITEITVRITAKMYPPTILTNSFFFCIPAYGSVL